MSDDNIRLENYWRYERKFSVARYDTKVLEAAIRRHPAFFSEIFPGRWVNNIYFDTAGLDCYFDNLDGQTNRFKVRIRWYNEANSKTNLEIKIKRGLVGGKLVFPLLFFNFSNRIKRNMLEAVISQVNLGPPWKWLIKGWRPTLFNRYYRKYYQSVDKKFRLTLDTAMHYAKIIQYDSLIKPQRDFINSVIELKYNIDDDVLANEVTSCLPFRLTKNSKYINGLEFI